MPRSDDLAAALAEIWRRILGDGEDAGAVLADLAQRDAERRAVFERERARLQAEIDACAAVVTRHEGRPQ